MMFALLDDKDNEPPDSKNKHLDDLLAWMKSEKKVWSTSQSVTHMHRLPKSCNNPYFQKPAWLPGSSAYAVGSPFVAGVYLLDFLEGKSSGCYIKPRNGASTSCMSYILPANRGGKHRFIPTSDIVLTCAAHPEAYTIMTGTIISYRFSPKLDDAI